MRSLERGLALLVALNQRPLASVCELAADICLPRPTVYRSLDTLCKAGFVRLDSATDRYCLAHGVCSLSDGFLNGEWVTKIAAPIMAEFTHKHVWPVSLFTFEAGKMLVRNTTHRMNTLSIDDGMVGRRMGMLRTASSLAYLAFCPDNERKVILDLLAQSSDSYNSAKQATSARAPNSAVASERLAVVIASHRQGLVATINHPTEDSAMPDEMMTLRTFLEKSADADLLREMIGLLRST